MPQQAWTRMLSTLQGTTCQGGGANWQKTMYAELPRLTYQLKMDLIIVWSLWTCFLAPAYVEVMCALTEAPACTCTDLGALRGYPCWQLLLLVTVPAWY